MVFQWSQVRQSVDEDTSSLFKSLFFPLLGNVLRILVHQIYAKMQIAQSNQKQHASCTYKKLGQ